MCGLRRNVLWLKNWLCEDLTHLFMFQSKIQELRAEIAKLKQSHEDTMMRLKEQHEEKAS